MLIDKTPGTFDVNSNGRSEAGIQTRKMLTFSLRVSYKLFFQQRSNATTDGKEK
jgi:hypothetical protein